MKDFDEHTNGTFATCDFPPHTEIDCFVKNLEKLFEGLENYLYHDLQMCGSFCASFNHHKRHPRLQYPALTNALYPKLTGN